MSNIVMLDGRQFKSSKELLAYCNSQYELLQMSTHQIKTLQEEVLHLQQLLAATTPLVGENVVQIYNKPLEHAIIEAQITLLGNNAMVRPLSLDEIKMLDVLIKNKFLCEEKMIPETARKKKKEYSDSELISIAKTQSEDGSGG